ncbi:hypothetical protein [Trabulsiella odontotermitis]|uniref:Uncharacterized protein n=1 Tax=Trabulsiella odontotermitis TaxID=379893 RepID=A0A0L0GZH7_9ENTR|nr:hypothetical protein [Trabulsiella odontotermitis]KNC94144.1 hypothetical protein GM31_16355 [Trabulsiella odontotermitis]
MTWKASHVTLPASVNGMFDQANGVLGSLNKSGIDALTKIDAKAGWPQPDNADSADKMNALRATLDTLTANGQSITVHPWQHGVGKEEKSGCYLSPANAAKRLAEKLADSSDSWAPTISTQAVALMVCAGSLDTFIALLEPLATLVATPGMMQALRMARSQAGLQNSKMQTGNNVKNPFWPTGGLLLPEPQRSSRKTLLGSLDMAGSYGTRQMVATLSALADKRQQQIQAMQTAWAELQKVKGNLWIFSADGSPQAIAGQIKKGTPGEDNVHTVVTLFTGDNLTFLREMTS